MFLFQKQTQSMQQIVKIFAISTSIFGDKIGNFEILVRIWKPKERKKSIFLPGLKENKTHVIILLVGRVCGYSSGIFVKIDVELSQALVYDCLCNPTNDRWDIYHFRKFGFYVLTITFLHKLSRFHMTSYTFRGSLFEIIFALINLTIFGLFFKIPIFWFINHKK